MSRTMSELVETALPYCSALNESGGESPPCRHADRDALYQAMEGR